MVRDLTRRLFTLAPRGIVGLILTLNAVVIIGAFLTGTLPSWPPGPHDIHVTEQTGSPLVTLAGRDNVNSGSVFTIWLDVSLSNSLLTMWLVMAVLVAVAWLATRDLREVPGPRQNLVELLVQGLADFMQGVGGPAVLRYLPLFGSLFLLLLLSNLLSVVPFVGQIELLHSPTADYHINFGLAVTAFVTYQALGIRKLGLSYFTRWINLSGFEEGPIVGVVMLVFVGPLELFSELFRMLTLTLRLWGNIWGGEITLAVLSALLLVPSLPLPFVGLEIFVAFIQAFIFAFLVLLYIILALESHDEQHTEEIDHGRPGPLAASKEVAQV